MVRDAKTQFNDTDINDNISLFATDGTGIYVYIYTFILCDMEGKYWKEILKSVYRPPRL